MLIYLKQQKQITHMLLLTTKMMKQHQFHQMIRKKLMKIIKTIILTRN